MYTGYYSDNFGNDTYKKINLVSNLNLKGKLLFGFCLLIVFIIALICINNVKNYFNSYGYLEKKMIKDAQNYITSNNLMITDEIYLDVTKIGTELKNNCSVMSGVFVDSSYKYKAYLDCDDYQSDVVDNNNSKVSLNGKEIIILGKDVTYIEQGVTGNKQVNIQGEVGNDEGVYNLKYIFVSNNSIIATLTRKVVVIDEIYINNLYPSIILNGDKIEYVQKGHKYNDKGVFSSDVIDLDLGNKVKTAGKVNINAVGEYEITYTVSNSRGYSNSITRKVVVVNNFSTTTITGYLSPEKVTSGNVTIYLKIVGNDYDYMVLPNGIETDSKIIEYVVNDNGTYNFISYDSDGKSITKIVNIDNIDNTKPNASCIANVYNDYTQIIVSPYKGKEIKSYNYMINGLSSGEILSKNYKSNDTDINSASVIIEDSIGNTNEITCTINEKNSYIRKMYVDQKGKNCLEGYVCYNQYDYSSSSVQFCSTDTCGPISKRGCSVTATATALSLFQLTDSSGNIYDPYSLTTEVFNKVCSRYCSDYNTIGKVAFKLGLSATGPYSSIKGHEDILKQFLKNGYPVIFRSGKGGAYPQETGHLLAILGINENDEVFLSDPGRSSTTSAQSSSHRVNTWVPISEIASGEGASAWFQAIGPAGLYDLSMSD